LNSERPPLGGTLLSRGEGLHNHGVALATPKEEKKKNLKYLT